MSKYLGYIIAMAASAALFLTSCGKDGGEVIPRKDMAEIYAEMLMTDQWILMTPNVRLIADTSLVYAPILERYGYDRDDYVKSIDHYMDDPERFAKIFRETGRILDEYVAELETRQAELERLEKLKKEAEKYRPDVDWKGLYPQRPARAEICLPDSMNVEYDTLSAYRLSFVERNDTVYDGVHMKVPAVDTSIAVSIDSTAVEKVDTLVLTELPKEKKLVAPQFMRLRDGKK
jgi:hypothetical protein